MHKFDKDEVCTACIHRVRDLFLTDDRSDARDAFEQGFKEGARWLYNEKMQVWHTPSDVRTQNNSTGESCLIEYRDGRFSVGNIYWSDYAEAKVNFYTYDGYKIDYNCIYRWAYIKDLLPPVID